MTPLPVAPPLGIRLVWASHGFKEASGRGGVNPWQFGYITVSQHCLSCVVVYETHMMIRFFLVVFLVAAPVLGGVFGVALAQTPTPPANVICKTGSDVDLPVIRILVADMASELKRLKQVKQSSRAGTDRLRTEILTIDQVLKPLRERHKSAAAQASSSTSTYALYTANWLDTGELARLNDKIRTRKQKHAAYKTVRAGYQAEKAAFETLGAKYQYIARDLLDRDRDCAAAQAALRAP